jgi:DNA-binding transcriptional LysR family regulator
MVRKKDAARKNRTGGTLPPMDFDLRQLEVFSRVVQLGSVSRAAEAVHLSQSSVSERISALEKAVGAPLFDRIGRRIEPTAIGMLLYQQALKHLALKEETQQALAEQLGASRGEISLGGSTIPGEYILPGVIKRFRDQYPLIVLRLSIGDSLSIASDVLEGRLTLGVVGARSRNAHLGYDQLWRDELVLVVPRGHSWTGRKAVSAADVLQEPFVLRESGSGTRQVMEHRLAEALRAKSIALNVAAELGSSTAIKSAVAAGLGVTMISSRAVAAEIKAGTLVIVPVENFSMPRYFYLTYDGRRTLSPVARVFREFLLVDADLQDG